MAKSGSEIEPNFVLIYSISQLYPKLMYSQLIANSVIFGF
jgi:hypothetical protein